MSEQDESIKPVNESEDTVILATVTDNIESNVNNAIDSPVEDSNATTAEDKIEKELDVASNEEKIEKESSIASDESKVEEESKTVDNPVSVQEESATPLPHVAPKVSVEEKSKVIHKRNDDDIEEFDTSEEEEKEEGKAKEQMQQSYLENISYEGDKCLYTEPGTGRKLVWSAKENKWCK